MLRLFKKEKEPTEQERVEAIRQKAAAFNATQPRSDEPTRKFGVVREQAPGIEIIDGEPCAIELNRLIEEIITRTWKTVHFNDALTDIMFGSYDIGNVKVSNLTIDIIRELDFLRDLHNGAKPCEIKKWEDNEWYNGRETFRDDSLRKYIG